MAKIVALIFWLLVLVSCLYLIDLGWRDKAQNSDEN
jgi:TRAP-type C4-dicarboxylate transport system permease small subunit